MATNTNIGNGRCVKCDGPLGMFSMRITVESVVIDARGVSRLVGLGQHLGSLALAEVMGPSRASDLVSAVTRAAFCVCVKCYCDGVNPAELEEAEGRLALPEEAR